MKRSELIRKLMLFPGEDPEIVTHGDDGNACTDVHVESLDDPWLRKINEAEEAIFISARCLSTSVSWEWSNIRVHPLLTSRLL